MFDFPTTPARSATRKWTALASIGLHAIVLFAVVSHRESTLTTVLQPPPDTTVWLLPSRSQVADQPRHPMPVGDPRPAPRFDNLTFPEQLPPPDLSAVPLDPASLTGSVSAGSLDSLLRGNDLALSPGAPRDWRTVDDPPRLLTPGALDYPPSLKGMGLEGSVRLRFVVDTTGRAIPETIEVISSTHPLFIPAAKKTVTESRFEPGKVNGRAVKVLVEQTIKYSER